MKVRQPKPQFFYYIIADTQVKYKWYWQVIISSPPVCPGWPLLWLFFFPFNASPALIFPPFSYCTLTYSVFSSFFVIPFLTCYGSFLSFFLYHCLSSSSSSSCLCPYHLYLIFPLSVSRFFVSCFFVPLASRVGSGGCGTTLWGNRSPPSSLETSTALPRSTEVTTGYLTFACPSLSPCLPY